MKIGIITFHKSINYGSALQAWALSLALQKLGAIPEIFDYEPNHYKELYGLLSFPKNRKIAKKDYIHLRYLRFYRKRNHLFRVFQQTKLPMSEKKYNAGSDISLFAKEKDVMLCGSDQIWNPMARDFDETFLLGNIKNIKKISYAASMGQADYNDIENKALFKKCISEFSYLSVREESSAEVIQELIGGNRPISIDLDPTLLHKKEDYYHIISDSKETTPYVFFYSVWNNPSAVRAATQFAKTHNLPIFTLLANGENKFLLRIFKSMLIPSGDVGPLGFLSMIKNARYIITDSFHGTAFSIIFEKEFWAINDTKGNNIYKNDNRIMNLLGKLGISDRYVKEEDINTIDLTKRIDYSSVTEKRMIEAYKSIEYLKKAIWS